MNFDLDEDQHALRDTVTKLIAREYSFEQRLKYAKLADGWSPDVWRAMSSIGLTALAIPQDLGGLGGSAADLMVVSETLGAAQLLEPYFSSAVLSASLLRHAPETSLRSELLNGIAEGTERVAFAHDEPGRRFSVDRMQVCATRQGEWTLRGRKRLVLHGDSATGLLVSARVAIAGREDSQGLFFIRPGLEGVSVNPYRLLNGMAAADIELHDVPSMLIAEGPEAAHAIERACCDAIASLCAEAVGTMDALHQLTIEYLKTRRQFGKSIGSFQALQHRAVDMLIAVEQARSMAMSAAMSADATLDERQRSVSASKVQICESSRFVSQQAIQLHGGIGVTLEYRAGHCVRHLLVLEGLLGDKEFHLDRLVRLGGVYLQ